MTKIVDVLPDGDTKRIAANWARHYATLRSKLRSAGLIQTNADLVARANAPGNITSIPFYNPLGGDSVVGSDDLTQKIVPGKITGGEALAVRSFRSGSWEGAQLTATVSGLKPLDAIGNMLAEWLATDEEKYFLAMLAGVAANAAVADAETMLAGSATAKFDGSMLIDAGQTKGERKDSLTTLVVHSMVHAQLQKDNLLVNVAASDQNVGFQTYLGKRIVISDAMPFTGDVYTSILCAPGVIAYGEGNVDRGTIAVVADEQGGNGFGGDQLIHRRQFIAGPQGYSYVGAANPTNGALKVADNYARVVDAAQIPLVTITSKVG